MITSRTLYPALAMILATAITIVSCKKEKTADDFDPPTISITEPVAGKQYNLTDTIFLLADFEDVSEIEDITVTLIYGANSVVIWPESPVIFGNVNTYHLDDEVIDQETVGATTPAIMRFYGSDKHGNSATKDVAVELL